MDFNEIILANYFDNKWNFFAIQIISSPFGKLCSSSSVSPLISNNAAAYTIIPTRTATTTPIALLCNALCTTKYAAYTTTPMITDAIARFYKSLGYIRFKARMFSYRQSIQNAHDQ